MSHEMKLTAPEYRKDYTTSRVKEWGALNVYKNAPAKFLEVGLLEGRTSRWFLENILTHPASRLVGVDPFDTIDPVGKVDMQADLDLIQHGRRSLESLAAQTHKFQLHIQESPGALRQFPEEYFDAIYIDGDHRAFSCLQDMAGAWRLLKPHGILLLDDYAEWGYSPLFPNDNPRFAVKAFLSCKPPHNILWEGYTVGIQKLPDTGRPR